MPTFRTLANMPPVWTSSPAGSPVSPSALPESGSEPPTPAGYGPNSGDSFAFYDRKQRCWKTSQVSFDTDLGESLVTWPRAGMTRNGTAYQLPPLAPLTAATAYSSSLHRGPNSDHIWPTATTQDHSTRFAQGGMPLGMAARLWPTPTAQRLGDLSRLRRGGSASEKEALKPGAVGTRSGELDHASVLSPMADPDRDWKLGRVKVVIAKEIAVKGTGQLNPQWVEWLMGFPAGWTDLED
jgi:hypothetical protein